MLAQFLSASLTCILVSDPMHPTGGGNRRECTPKSNPFGATICRHVREVTASSFGSYVFNPELSSVGCLRIRGIFHHAGSTLHVQEAADGSSCASPILVAMRPNRQPHFSDREGTLLNTLTPHVQRAMEFSGRLERIRRQQDDLAAVTDELFFGLILLNTRGKVLGINRAAGRIIEQKDGLLIRDGILQAQGRNENAVLERLVASVGGTLAISRPSMRRPYSLTVSSLHRDNRFPFGEMPSVVVFLVDPGFGSRAPEALLRKQFDLTPTQSCVCRLLLEGRDPKAIAAELKITENTAREHLKALFLKTDTKRQSELISLLTRAAAPAAGLSPPLSRVLMR